MEGLTALALNNPAIGFIAIGGLAFLLGVLVTVLGYFIHEFTADSDEEDWD